jgi:hypothetical protein
MAKKAKKATLSSQAPPLFSHSFAKKVWARTQLAIALVDAVCDAAEKRVVRLL